MATGTVVLNLVIGVDEVGRGPLAGPLISCAVLLSNNHGIDGLDDSKKLSAKKRNFLASIIEQRALAVGFGRAEVDEIDELNVLQATMRAMERAVAAVVIIGAPILIDGNRVPDSLRDHANAVVGGDKSIAAISAASILAKVARDREMAQLAITYPGYGFEKNAGYPTNEHLRALAALGATPIHRKTFRPVRELLESQ